MQDTSIRTLNPIFCLAWFTIFWLASHCNQSAYKTIWMLVSTHRIAGIEIPAFQHALTQSSGHSAMQEKKYHEPGLSVLILAQGTDVTMSIQFTLQLHMHCVQTAPILAQGTDVTMFKSISQLKCHYCYRGPSTCTLTDEGTYILLPIAIHMGNQYGSMSTTTVCQGIL